MAVGVGYDELSRKVVLGVLRIILYLTILTGTLFRLWYCVDLSPVNYVFSDAGRHWGSGARLWNPGILGLIDPPGFQVFVWFVRGVSQDNSLGVGVCFGLLSACMPWLYYRAARECGLARMPALYAWALIVWYPSVLVIYHYVMVETLLMALVGLAAWMTGRYLRKRTLPAMLVMWVVWILAMLTKTVAVPLAVTAIMLTMLKTQPPVRHVGICLVVGAALLVPNSIRTYRYLGFVAPFGVTQVVRTLHVSGAKGIQVLVRNDPDGTDQWGLMSPNCFDLPLAPLSYHKDPRSRAGITSMVVDCRRGETDWNKAYWQAVKAANPKILAHERWENTLHVLFAPSWPDTTADLESEYMNYALRWTIAPLIAVTLLWGCWCIYRRELNVLALSTSACLLFLLFQNEVTVEARYRKVVEPLMLVCAVQVVTEVRRQTSAWKL